MLSFNDIIGQEGVKAHLTSALAEKKISHAYIFAGEDGSGKMMLAERFAAALQCDSEGTDPCGACLNCMQSEAHSHPDIIYVTHEKKDITVDDIRLQLVNDIRVLPYSGRYKIYIVDEAEKMNEPAQNALLKTLEEPPEYAVILLLAENTGKFLQTILSRCVVLDMRPVERTLIRDYLMAEKQLPDYVANLCASFSCGCIGKARRIAEDEGFIEAKDRVLRLVCDLDRMSQSEISAAIAAIGDKNSAADLSDYFDLLSMWYRDVLVYKSTHNAERVLFSENLHSVAEQAEAKSFPTLNNIFIELDLTRERLKNNVSFPAAMQLLIEAMKAK
ncbi:MAG: DNA polymerase III subunit delta' [Lachnospiraceae bacterium]|nr:DNA polymerase III subunit delta' [Lachnospiraceae bacterium]